MAGGCIRADATCRTRADHGRRLLPVYAQMPVRRCRGQGSWLIDEDGHEWLDAYGGHAVASTGHCHPDVVRAIADQARELLFYSTAVPASAARERWPSGSPQLCPTPLERVFFCNSGAEANENALHLARQAHRPRRRSSRVRGRLARPHRRDARRDRRRQATRRAHAGPGCRCRARSRSTTSRRSSAAVDETVAAVIVEPVQGFAGARDCSPEFLRGRAPDL